MQIILGAKESWGGVADCQHINHSEQGLSIRMSNHGFPRIVTRESAWFTSKPVRKIFYDGYSTIPVLE